jgi:hypothetical protein
MTECRIKKVADDGVIVDLPDATVVAPIQMPGAIWIKDLKIQINQREIFSSNQLYSYKAYLDAELSFPTSTKDSFLNVAGYVRDVKDPDSITDAGYIGRKNMFAKSRTVQTISKLSADIFNQDLYMISNVEIDIEITLQTDEFMIIQGVATDKYIFEITDVRLLIKTIDLMDGLSLDIARKLDIEPARYGIRKTFMKSLFITQGHTEFVANIFTEEWVSFKINSLTKNYRVLRRVILGLVSNSRYIGSNIQVHAF